MKGLDEIYISRTRTHKERGANGFVKDVTKTYREKLVVKTVKPTLRFVHLIADYFTIVIFTIVLSIFFDEDLAQLLALLIMPIYYTFMEYKFQQTFGKMITNSIVITQYCERPTLRISLLRTLIRLVPFEPFSCLGTPSRGWHDRWTETFVISKNDLPKLVELLKVNEAKLPE